MFASSPPLSITLDGTENPVLQNQVWVTEPRQWSAEFPFLYNLVVEVTDDSGYTVDVRSMAWGFRQIEILGGSQGGMLTLNGQSIKVQGVRHGNSHPSELTDSDLMLMKRLNINALYCPLHPLPATLYEIADKIGLYIVDSAIADSQGIAAVVPRHRNHPSVIIWSLECETPSKYFFREMKEAVKSLDDSRPVYCHGDRSVSDVLWCSGPLPARPQGKPVLIGAAAHELESSPVSFIKEMEERMDVGGVFVCDFVDPESSESGIVTSQRQWKSEAMELQTLYAPVSIEPADMENGTITVSNRHFFIDLFDYEIYWSLQRNGEIVAGGMVRQPSIAPGGSKNVHLFRELAAFPGRGEGFLTFSLRLSEDNTWAAAGDEIAKMQIPVPETAKSPRAYPRISLSNSITSDAVTQKPDAEEERQDIPWQYKILGSDLLAVRADVGVRVNLVNGLMESLDFGLGSMLTMGLTPDVSGQAAVSTKLAGYKIKQHSGSLELWLKLKAPAVGRHLRLTLRLMTDGRISFLLRGSPANPKTNLGVQFGLQSRYRQVKWYGCGPHSACSVDQKSAIVGLYSMQDDEHWDCRKRIGVRWMEFSDGGNALRISEEGGLLNFSCRFGPAGTSGEGVGAKEGGGSDYLHVCIDGGDECGKKASLSRTRELQFTFSLKKHV